MPRPSSPVHAKASTKCPYLTLENPHHQRQHCLLQCAASTAIWGYSLSIVINLNAYVSQLDQHQSANPAKSRYVPHRFLEPIYNVKDGAVSAPLHGQGRKLDVFIPGKSLDSAPSVAPQPREFCYKMSPGHFATQNWWSLSGSNR